MIELCEFGTFESLCNVRIEMPHAKRLRLTLSEMYADTLMYHFRYEKEYEDLRTVAPVGAAPADGYMGTLVGMEIYRDDNLIIGYKLEAIT